MSTIDEIRKRQEGKYSSVSGEPMWPVVLGALAGLTLVILCVVVTQNMVARDLGYDPQLGQPTIGQVYLSPVSSLVWRLRCWRSTNRYEEHRPIPACTAEPTRSAALHALGKYDGVDVIGGIVSLLVCTLIGAVYRDRKFPRAKRASTHGDGRWEEFDRISEAGLLLKTRKQMANPKGKIGFPLGVLRHEGKTYYVFTNPDAALGVLLLGPPNSGKTSCYYIPHLLTDPTSKFVYDPSLEMWKITAGWRSLPRSKGGAGNICMLFCPEKPEISCHINPVDAVKWEERSETATLQTLMRRLLDHADKAAEGSEAHWIATGGVLGECVLIHLHYTDPKNCNLEGLYNYLALFEDSKDGKGPTGVDLALQEIINSDHRQGREDLDHIFRDSDGELWDVHPYAFGSAKETLQKAPNEKSGVISTLRRFLQFARDKQVAEVTRYSDLSFEDAMRNKMPLTLYYGLSPAAAQRLRPLTGLFANILTFTHMGDDALDLDTGEFRYVHPMDLDIDEAAQMKKQEQLFMSWAMARKYGIQPNLGYQDVSQIYAAAGGQNDEAVTSVCEYKVFMRPNKPETAEWISHKILGKTTGEDNIRNFSGNRLGYLGHAQTQRSLTSVDLFSPQALMEMEPHIAIVKAGSLAPFFVETMYYKNDAEMLRRSQIPPPKKSMAIPMERRAYRPPWWKPTPKAAVESAEAIVASANGKAHVAPPPAPAPEAPDGATRLQQERSPAKELVGVAAPNGVASPAIAEPTAEAVPQMSTTDPNAVVEVTEESAREIEDALAQFSFDEPAEVSPANDPMNG